MSLEGRTFTIILNSSWQFTGKILSAKDALTNFFNTKEKKFDALCIDYNFVDGDYDYANPQINPVGPDKWFDLPIFPYTPTVSINNNKKIRIPTILIAKRYGRVHYAKKKPSKNRIWERDKGVCQYTGKQLTKTNGNIHHIVPQSKGGDSSWENMILCDKNLNSKLGDKMPNEHNIKPIKQPSEPSMYNFDIRIKHRDWKLFV